MTTKTDKKDPRGWGGLFCVHAFARPVLAGTGNRGGLFARPATAGTVRNGLRNNKLYHFEINGSPSVETHYFFAVA